jgi:hypothetical protein
MNIKATTWILIAALAVVAGYFFLVDEKDRARNVTERAQGAKLFPYRAEEVDGFVLVNPKGERIEVARDGSGWKIVAPVETRGAGPEISSFVAQLVPGIRSSELQNVRNVADYGLEKPFATVIMRRSGGASSDTLLVGDATPAGSKCYVRLGSSPNVLLSSEITRNLMNKGLFHLRDKNFLPEGYGGIDAVEIRSTSKRIRLVNEAGMWRLEPGRTRANRRTIESYLSRLADAVIHEFVREDTGELAPYGLASPVGEIVLTEGRETTTISFGSRKDYLVHVVRTGLDKVVALEATLLEPFDWTAAGLRAMNLAFVEGDSVRSLRYETPDTSIVFERTDRQWRIADRETATIRGDAVNALLRRLDETAFERMLKEPLPVEGVFETFTLRVVLADARGNVIDRIAITVRSDGSERGASLSANALGSLERGTAAGIEAIFQRIGAS